MCCTCLAAVESGKWLALDFKKGELSRVTGCYGQRLEACCRDVLLEACFFSLESILPKSHCQLLNMLIEKNNGFKADTITMSLAFNLFF